MRKADLLGLLAVLVVVAAVVADEVDLLFVAAALLVLMAGADRRPRPRRSSTPTGFDPDVGYPARLTAAHAEVEAVRMADDDTEQQTEQATEDSTDVEAGDDADVVIVQQGDDLVSFQGNDEVDRRPIVDEAQAEPEGGSNDA